MGTAPDWTPEEDAWLREYYPVMRNWELAEFKALDGWPRDEAAICRHARKLGLAKDPARGYVRRCRMPTIWTPERDAWLRAYVPGHSDAEVVAEHERVFGFPLTPGQVSSRKTRLGLRSGTVGGRFEPGHVPANRGRPWSEWMPEASAARSRRTQFAPGDVPHNAGERLDERRATDGAWRVKVDCRDARGPMGYWVSRARFNWERANGRPWPEGCRACHVDGDGENDDPANVVPVPEGLWPTVCGAAGGGLPQHDRETLETAVAYARVTARRRGLERERRAIEGHPWAQDLRKPDRGLGSGENEQMSASGV